MWKFATEPVDSGVRLRFCDDDEPISFRKLLQLLQQSPGFAAWYSAALADCGQQAFFWELPALTMPSLDQESECALIGSNALARLRPDPAPFKRRFDAANGKDVVTFANLGGDAVLVAPCPVGPPEAYPHLAAFLRDGPREQIASLWSEVARVVLQTITAAPTWLSTSGLGVAWLHIRLDSLPKYYQHPPYKSNSHGEALQ